MGLTQRLGTIPLAIQTDSSNNVGIGGTPSGTYGKLSVFGGVSIKDDNNAKLEIGRYSSGASNSYIKLGANSNSLRISNATDSADLITFTNSGNVGIGTTTPALTTSNRTTLDIGNATESILVLSTGGSWRSYFYNDGTNLSIANSGGFINFDVLGERMRITNTGNVGIGTSSPASGRKLTVAGGAQFTYTDNGGASFNIVPGTNGQDGADFNLSYYTGTGYGPLTFTLGGSERMRITSGGQVNINSTQTTYPFYVQASIANWMAVMENSASSSSGLLIRQTGGAQGFYYGAYDGSAYKFFVNGSGVVNSTSTSITIISSDQKLKTDIRDYDKGLAEVLAMKPRIYKRKDNLEIDEVGFIAQEMDIALAGSMIESYKDEDGEPIHTYQLEWYPLLVKAIQELNAKVTALENK